MEQLDTIKTLINEGDIARAISLLDAMLHNDNSQINHDVIYYLKDNAYRKMGDWQQSLNNYQKAIDINHASLAVHARKAVIEILDFYHKDMFIQ